MIDQTRSIQALGLQSLLAGVSAGVVIQDHAGRILYGNPAAERILGLSLDQLRGRTSVDPRWQSIHEDGRPFPGEEHPALVTLRTGLPVRDAVMGVRKPDGSLTWIAIDTERVPAADGDPPSVVSTFRDVTEAKAGELALRQRETLLQTFIESTPAAVAMFDREMRYLAVSRRYAGDYRLAVSDLVGRSHYQVFPEIPERWRVIHRRCLAGAVERCEEDPFPRQDGTTDWIRWELRPWHGDGGEIGGLILFSENVTEQKQARARLQAERERLDVTTRSIGDAVIATDNERRITILNEVAETLTGWTQAEALGRPLGEVFPIVNEETRRPCEDPVSRVLREDTVVGLANHTLLVARDGSERPIADSVAPIRNTEGRVIGVVLVFRDQSEERARERSLHQAMDRVERSERRYRLLADHAHDVIWTLDLASQKYTYVSPSITALRGLTVDEALAEPVERSLLPGSLARVQAVMARIGGPAEEDPHTGIYDQPCKDGTVKHIELTTSLVRDATGRPVEVVGVSRDATARVEAELALRESVERYRTLSEEAADALYVHDFEGRLRDVNRQACECLGYTREELLSMTVPQVDPSFDLESARRQWARIQPGVPLTLASTNRRKDGTTFPVEVRFALVTVGGERLVLGHSRDITDRVKAEEALRRSEERFRAMFEQAAVGIAEMDASSGRFLRVNDTLCRLTGYSREELLTRRWQDLTHPDDLAEELAFGDPSRWPSPFRREKRYLRKDGAPVWIDLTVGVMSTQAGAPGSHVSVILDITERKLAEERYRAFTERSSDLTLVLDENATITFASPATRQILGLAPSDLVGRHGREVVHPEDAPMVAQSFARMRADPSLTLGFELRLRNAGGGWTLLEARGRNLLDVPSVRGIVINHRDITERNRFRDQFLQAQKLESVGRLAGGVAHDFNNLLTVILGCSESVLERLGSQPSENREDVDEIRAAGERARDLTGQLLAFARKQVISPVVVDLNSVVRGQQRMLGRLLGEDVELEVRLQHLPWTTFADPSQIGQVLLNLAVNARDAMPKGGTLTIETLNRTVEEHESTEHVDLRPGYWVQLRVSDTGVGISTEVQAHLFEPFFTTKEQGKGTGLGLATIYGIVAQAGGHVHVKSAPGSGTTFQVCLPRVERPETPQPPAPAAAAAAILQGTERILVVEDDALVRDVIVRVLSSAGYRVRAMGQPQQALGLADDDVNSVELLITDVVMPSIDGHTLAQHLTRRFPALRVLYLSGYTRDVISERGVIDSGLNFLAKPFTRTTLLAKVREVLDAR